MDTYDEAGFDRFCADLVEADFSPVAGKNQAQWTGPIRPSLKPLTEATTMLVHIYEGWPLRYAHIEVRGLTTEHAGDGIVCLWNEDDPAQIAGRDLNSLWDRLDQWAERAQEGFREEDKALDAYLLWGQEDRATYEAEVPLGDFVRHGNTGLIVQLVGRVGGQGDRTLFLRPANVAQSDHSPEDDRVPLRGALYLNKKVDAPPRNLQEIRAALTRRQRENLERGLEARAPVGVAEPSGGYDFIVFSWRRHGTEHDALVVAFQGHPESLKAYVLKATPSDTAARQRRAGPDAGLLAGKTVVVAGAGSVGGHVALALAASGVTKVRIHDSDYLRTANLVRHLCPESLVGYSKARAVSVTLGHHAPWTDRQPLPDLPLNADALAAQIAGADVVVDCTGSFALSAALAQICQRDGVALISGSLYHQGALIRVRRQAGGDTPIAARRLDPNYLDLPPEDPTAPNSGFLELGCTSPVNNAPPTAVLTAATEIALSAVDFMTGRKERPDETIVVLRPMNAPFDRLGLVPAPDTEAGAT